MSSTVFCEPGKFLTDESVCEDCFLGYYKDVHGNGACIACPNVATTTADTGSTSEAQCSIGIRVFLLLFFNLTQS